MHYVIAIVAGLIFLTLTAQSGALVWAIVGGIGVAGVTFFVARDLIAATTFGGLVALGIAVFGIANMLTS